MITDASSSIIADTHEHLCHLLDLEAAVESLVGHLGPLEGSGIGAAFRSGNGRAKRGFHGRP